MREELAGHEEVPEVGAREAAARVALAIGVERGAVALARGSASAPPCAIPTNAWLAAAGSLCDAFDRAAQRKVSSRGRSPSKAVTASGLHLPRAWMMSATRACWTWTALSGARKWVG